jgi:rRNA maturation endonuclease Nob1
MRLKIAVTDACIFIDLYDLGLVHVFFNLELEIHTTAAVIFELYHEQQEVLKAYQLLEKLTVHNLVEEDFVKIHAAEYPKSLSETDKTVLHIANKINASVLSSDKAMRNCAKNKAIEYHGMIWIFDQFVSGKHLTKKEACKKLQELVAINLLFRNNKQLTEEIQKRLKLWG